MNLRDAINEVLSNLNELPLDVGDLIKDVPTAIIVNSQLEIARRKVLSYGWNFNSLTYTLTPNNEGYIVIPSTWLSVDGYDDNDLIVRDYKLFDKAKMSYTFSGSVKLDVIEDSLFDDIPFHIANYIIQVASLQSYINIIGNTDDISLRKLSVDNARLEAIRDDANKIDGNLLDSTFATTLLDRTSK